jgi:hypothetical protein
MLQNDHFPAQKRPARDSQAGHSLYDERRISDQTQVGSGVHESFLLQEIADFFE